MQSLPWIFLRSIKIGFGAIEVVKVDVAGARQLAREMARQAARDF
jgi:hypothetical protein